MNLPLRLILTLFLLFPWIHGYTQNKSPMRIEIPCEDNTRPFELIPMGTEGLILFYRTNTAAAKDQTVWEFSSHTLNLKQNWIKGLEISSDFEYKYYVRTQNAVVILFQNTASKAKGDQLLFVKVNLADQTVKGYKEVLPAKASLRRFLLLDTLAVVGYNSPDKQAGFFIKALPDGAAKHIFPEAGEKSWLDDLGLDSITKQINCLYEYFPERKRSVFRIRRYDLAGNLRDSLPDLDFSANGQSVNSVIIKEISQGNILLLGSYSNQAEKTFNEASERVEESTGFFSCRITDRKITASNFYNFLSFKHFFNKIRGNQAIYEGGIKKNKETSSDYRLIFHPIMEKNGEFLLISEAYYPEYHTVTNWTYDYYGHMVPNYYTVFDGYRYNNTLVAGFDSLGALKWDNSFEINNIITFRLRHRINILLDREDMVMAYNYNGKIGSKILNKGDVSGNIDYNDLSLLHNSDRLISDDESNMEYWYDNYLLAYGYQEIKNSTRTPSRRYVFYINKIAYR